MRLLMEVYREKMEVERESREEDEVWRESEGHCGQRARSRAVAGYHEPWYSPRSVRGVY